MRHLEIKELAAMQYDHVVIGGGIAGLYVADFLNRGGRRTLLLEKNSSFGGKTIGTRREGRPYDLGAIMVPKTCRSTVGMARRFKEPTRLMRPFGIFDDAGSRRLTSLRQFSTERTGVLDVIGGMTRLQRQYSRQSDYLDRPGLDRPPPELRMPYSEWCADVGVTDMLPFAYYAISSMGYGSLDDIEAFRALKLLRWGAVRDPLPAFVYSAVRRALRSLGVSNSRFLTLDNGLCSLAGHLSETIPDIQSSCRIECVERTDHNVEIGLASGDVVQARSVIIACPLDQIIDAIRMPSAGEHAVAASVRYTDYVATVAIAHNMPRDYDVISTIDSTKSISTQHPISIFRKYPNSDIMVFYQYRNGRSDSELDREIAKLATDLGGDLESLMERRNWRHDPRLGPIACQAEGATSGYDVMAGLQGQNRTYYVGSWLACETIEITLQFSHMIGASILACHQ